MLSTLREILSNKRVQSVGCGQAPVKCGLWAWPLHLMPSRKAMKISRSPSVQKKSERTNTRFELKIVVKSNEDGSFEILIRGGDLDLSVRRLLLSGGDPITFTLVRMLCASTEYGAECCRRLLYGCRNEQPAHWTREAKLMKPQSGHTQSPCRSGLPSSCSTWPDPRGVKQRGHFR